MTEDLITRLQTEADQCRNDGADDIARLLDEAVNQLTIVGRQLFETEGRASALSRGLASAQGCISEWVKFGSNVTAALGLQVLSPKDALQAITELRSRAVPAGMALVPVEPNTEMQVAGFESEAWDALSSAVLAKKGWPYSCRQSAECVSAIWRAMLAAAPAPATAAVAVERQRDIIDNLRRRIVHQRREIALLRGHRKGAAPAAPELLPAAYLTAKLIMVMPVMQEARDALTALTVAQRQMYGIAPDLAARMDRAGTFSLDDWKAEQPGEQG